MTYILAIDAGTTNSRALLIDKNGDVVATEQEPFVQHYPDHGLVEHDPEELWDTQLNVVSQLLEKSGISPSEIDAIGITNQRETTIIWDRVSGKPIWKAIVWSDRRTKDSILEIKDKHEKMIHEKTGLLVDTYFSASKIKWVLNKVPGSRERAKKGELLFGNVNTYLLWKLTKGEVFATDLTNACRTLLYNIHTHEWDDDLLKLFDVPKEMLPKVVSNSEVYGNTHVDYFGVPIKIASMIGDQQGAMFGHACFDIGDVKCTYGTGSFMLINTGSEPKNSSHHLLTTIAWQIGDNKPEYALEGVVPTAGSAVSWLRDKMGILRSAKEIESLAFSVPDSGGVFFVPSLNGLASPRWNASARGTIFGITASTNIGHIARATLEGIAHQVTDVLEVMHKDTGSEIKQIKVGGGMTEDVFLMQMQTDLFGVDIVRSASKEVSALGAAYLAGLAVGTWKDLDEIRSLWKSDRKFTPELNKSDVKKMRSHWNKAVNLTVKWADD